ncbi:lipolytic enzyme [Azorhizobium caulinodans ORS 571]|uniref:Lipolytic enzyme n=1 Tax=Azorhizobium caulinodans (strain ATCC 43989 / DSM 5975 / JCM 20966 / LMG 6465 / NBRC 14845 / NCIMB 13405 / ORS 571) TaxID=438753 RepID=A8HRV1_AZOC5|nr:alpha/beta hydrolase [Azorhizobium caulinodans]BAF90097.1 lipolytic enzyme [Azorhizobium caulinodans ORS 571]
MTNGSGLASRPLDPALRAYLDSLAPPPGTPVPQTDAEILIARRTALETARAVRTTIPGLPNGVETADIRIDDDLRGRLYQPGRDGPHPLLIYFHGGGWAAGSLETHDPFCRLLSAAADVLILSVDYRLAPEHPFPAGLEDAMTAARFVLREADHLGGDRMRLAIGGDSAGGNLAAAALNRLATAGLGSGFRAQMLLYPVTDLPDAGHPSYEENARGYGLEADLMRWFWRIYAPGVSGADFDAAPLRHPNLPPLPPTLITTAQYDVLRDEAVVYAHKLQAAGVTVTHLHAPDMHHDFAVGGGTVARFPQCVATLRDIAGWLKAALG